MIVLLLISCAIPKINNFTRGGSDNKVENRTNITILDKKDSDSKKGSKLSKELNKKLNNLKDSDKISDVLIYLNDPSKNDYPVFPHTAVLEQTSKGIKLKFNGKNVKEQKFKDFNKKINTSLTNKRKEHKKRQNKLVEKFLKETKRHVNWRGVKHSANIIKCNLNKKEISNLLENHFDNIDFICLVPKMHYGLDTSISTTNVKNFAHGYGFRGSGVGIWTRETIEPKPAINGHFEVFPWEKGEPKPHATAMAEILVSQDNILKGFAPKAFVYSGVEIAGDLSSVLDYQAPGQPPIYISSSSWSVGNDSGKYNDVDGNGFIDDVNVNANKKWDDFSYYNRIFCTFLTQNHGANHYVASPGIAHNVLTVGGFNDRSSPFTMYDGSQSANPTSTNGDRQKPEVVAPGVGIKERAYNQAWTGTSCSSPMVAGMAADLMSSTDFYKYRPEVVKASIMAGAINNIEGDTRLSNRDGAGGVDYLNTQFYRAVYYFEGNNNTYFDNNGNVYVYYNLQAGRRYRVVLVWSTPGLYPYENNGQPQMDLNLSAGRYYGETYSNSKDNAYEILDFRPAYSGQYTFLIHRVRNSYDSHHNYSDVKMALSIGYGDLH